MPVGTITLNSGVGYALGALCLAMLSVGVLRYTRDRRAGARDLTREQRARLRDQQQVRQAMEELLAQLEEVTRRIDTDVDTRFAKLEGLLRAADERIRVLQKSNDAPAVRQVDPPTAGANSSEGGGQAEPPETETPLRARAMTSASPSNWSNQMLVGGRPSRRRRGSSASMSWWTRGRVRSRSPTGCTCRSVR